MPVLRRLARQPDHHPAQPVNHLDPVPVPHIRRHHRHIAPLRLHALDMLPVRLHPAVRPQIPHMHANRLHNLPARQIQPRNHLLLVKHRL